MATGRKMETLGDLQRFKEAMLANVDELTAYEVPGSDPQAEDAADARGAGPRHDFAR